MHKDFEHLGGRENIRQAEAQSLADKINDPRLRADESLEYFTLHLKNGVRSVPKRRIQEPENVNEIIEERLIEILKEET